MKIARGVTFISFWIAVAGLLLVTTNESTELLAATGVVLLTLAFCAYVGLRQFYLSRNDAIPDFLTVFLLFQLIHKAMTLMSLVVLASEDSSLVNEFQNVYRWQAEAVFLASTILFWLGWRIVIRRPGDFALGEQPLGALSRVYIASLTLYALAGPLLGLSVLGTLVPLLRSFALGVVTIMLYGKSDLALGRRRCWIPLLMLMPFAIIAVTTASKSEIVIVAMPVIISAMKSMSGLRATILALLTLFMFAFAVPVTEELRVANWSGRESISGIDAAERVLERWQHDGFVATTVEAGVKFVSRASSAEAGALVMSIAERDGHIGSIPIQGLWSILIPRVLWPDKPMYAPGAWFSWYLGFAPSPEAATTATATMLGTEMYWMYGIAGVVLGMTGLGILYALTWKSLAAGARKSPLAVAALFAFLLMAIRFEENATIYAISGPIILLIYVKVIAWAHQLFRAHRPGMA